MSMIPFRELMEVNEIMIKEEMRWENYDLNETILAVTEKVKEDAFNVLKREYGRTQVEPEILDYVLNDVFLYFPSLLQQLSITRLVDSLGVAKEDVDRTTLIRNENLSNETDQLNTSNNRNTSEDSTISNGENTVTNTGSDVTTLNTQATTSGTISSDTTSSNTQNSTTNIENTSDIEATGSRNVNVSHNMPEQALDETGNFQTDEQGTPILSAAYVQAANEGFSTSNPINSKELSEQIITATDTNTSNEETENTSTTTNTGTNSVATTSNGNEISSDTTTTNRVDVGTGTNETTTSTTGTVTTNETVETTTTNKQYAYEIKAFLETADSINAFKNWVNIFSWVDGIV